MVQAGEGTPVTTDAVLDGSMMIREMRGGTAYATYLNGPRGPEYRRDDTNGAVKWYVYDGLGSMVGEIDPSGNMTATRSHDVYGLARTWTGQRTSAHGFVGSLGHTSEDNTGLIYMRARYMDPVLGRFANEDSSKDGNNWFIYCNNDPVNSVDPSGKNKVDLFVAGEMLSAIAFSLTLASSYMLGFRTFLYVEAAMTGFMATICFAQAFLGMGTNGKIGAACCISLCNTFSGFPIKMMEGVVSQIITGMEEANGMDPGPTSKALGAILSNSLAQAGALAASYCD